MAPLGIGGFETEGFQALCDYVSYENFPGTPAEAMERMHRVCQPATSSPAQITRGG